MNPSSIPVTRSFSGSKPNVYDSIQLMDQVASDLQPVRTGIVFATVMVGLNIFFNALALVFYYVHLSSPTFIIIRLIVGSVALLLIIPAYRQARYLSAKYKAP